MELGGRPQGNVTLARYSAKPTRLASPRGVQARRLGKGVKVRWQAVTGAAGYLVSARLSDGRRLVLPVHGHARAIVITPVTRRVSVAVHVSALQRGGMPGPHSRDVRIIGRP